MKINKLTDAAIQIDDVFIDTIALSHEAEMLGDGKAVHNVKLSLAIIQNYITLARRRGIETLTQERLLSIVDHFTKLRALLKA